MRARLVAAIVVALVIAPVLISWHGVAEESPEAAAGNPVQIIAVDDSAAEK